MMKNVFYQIHIFLNRGELNKYLVSYKGTERLSDSEKKKKAIIQTEELRLM